MFENKFDDIYLGKNYVVSSDCNKTQCNNNVLVIGGSGSGKTRSVLEPRLLTTFNDNLIVTLSKRRLIAQYTNLFKERGYTVLNMDLVEPKKANCSFDPLRYIKNPNDILNLSRAIIMSDTRKLQHTSADPYWDEAAISLLSSYIGYVLLTKNNPTFGDVLEIHNKLEISDCSGGGIETEFGNKVEKLYSKMNVELAKFSRNSYRTFGMLGAKTARCIHSTASAILANMFTPELIKMMATRESIDFSIFGSNMTKVVLFISSSAVATHLHTYINIFYDQMFRSLIDIAEKEDNLSLPKQTSLLADDFAVGSPIPNFHNTISIIREYNISVMLLLQSESQLASIYKSDAATTIRNNADSFIYLGGNDLQTAKDVSERANLPLEDILYMPVGKQIVFRRGCKPKICERYNVIENITYRQKIMNKYIQER